MSLLSMHFLPSLGLEEKKKFLNLFFQRSKISTAIKLQGGGGGG